MVRSTVRFQEKESAKERRREAVKIARARVHFRAIIERGKLQVVLQPPDKENANWNEIAKVLESLLRFDAETWTHEEWLQMLGTFTPPAHWTTRTLLLCRAQIAAHRYPATSNWTDQYLMLPGGDVVSPRLFWPRNQRQSAALGQALKRTPENVLLYALDELFEMEKQAVDASSGTWWSDGDLADRLVDWLRSHSATTWWLAGMSPHPQEAKGSKKSLLGEQDVQTLREKLKGIELDLYLPTMTERKKKKANDAR